MHRSGTTMMSKIVHKSGIFMGAKKTGNYESVFFQGINRSLFKANSKTWDKPGDNNWEFKYFDIDVLSFYKEYMGLNALNYLKNGWGWKDPRNTYTLPFWLKLFPEAKVLHIYRDGIDVALSLHKRSVRKNINDLDYSERMQDIFECFRLWEEYVDKALSYTSLLNSRLLSLAFEKLIIGDRNEIDRLIKFCGRDIREKLLSEVDGTRTKRYGSDGNGEHSELIKIARKSRLMNKLGYLDR